MTPAETRASLVVNEWESFCELYLGSDEKSALLQDFTTAIREAEAAARADEREKWADEREDLLTTVNVLRQEAAE